ncbi:AraC family transcriptional regulator [Lentzea sp. NBRC 102530]|uniref:helix-turn-helix domain-containing protein n=1 Tax=Lentzea sp. NBRC 102530 TaxID=3032201 RepID=UPI00255784C9|nr:AraC family transcriptional regulator [Lentzea sp. NBRC 102530]
MIRQRQIGDVLVLTLPRAVGELGSGLLATALAEAVVPAATLVVLDLRGVALVSVHTARTLLAFADGRADRGVECVLVPDPASTAVSVVLDAVDPGASVPRCGTVDQALAGRVDTDLQSLRLPGSVTRSVSFDGTDVERVEELLSTAYAPMRIRSAQGRPRVSLTRVAAGEISVDELELGFGVTYDAAPLGRVCLVDVEAGAVSEHLLRGGREPAAFEPGELFAFGPTDSPVSGRADDVRATVTLLGPDLFARVVGHRVRLLGHRPHDGGAAAGLRTAIAHVRDTVLATADPDPLLVSTASQYVAASVLRAFPSTALSASPVHESDAHFQTLRRAMAFIESNADRDIAAADIATGTSVTARAVQLAFQQHLGMTPMAYLRRVRLECARTDLQAADPGEATVTRIGARWGFSRASTFAAQYRAAYGESPSQTLRA